MSMNQSTVVETVTLRINGKEVSVPKGTSILNAANSIGADVPNFCYDKSLTIYGGCRICVVEVEGARTLIASCSTEATEGMVVETESPRVVKARREILDLIYANHPMDCLTCEKVGKCKLQDYCYRYGVSDTTYKQGAKRNLPKDTANPMYERDMNKCILCGKCVNVCKEVQVSSMLEFSGRGFDTLVATAFDKPMSLDNCRFCGQCVEICPVGALIHKPFKGTRPWEVEKVRTTCPFCGTGCTFDLNVKDGKVIGVTTYEDAPVNGNSLCVKGRYHTDFIYSEDRITTPLIKKNGKFEEATWEEALDLVASKFKQIKEEHGGHAIAGLSSARCVNEDNFAFQKFFRVTLGTNNIDHCART